MFPDDPQSNPLDDIKRGQVRIMAALSQLAKNQQLQAHAMTAIAQAVQTLGEALDAMAQPKRIIRGEDGKIIGLETASKGDE